MGGAVGSWVTVGPRAQAMDSKDQSRWQSVGPAEKQTSLFLTHHQLQIWKLHVPTEKPEIPTSAPSEEAALTHAGGQWSRNENLQGLSEGTGPSMQVPPPL